MKTTLPKLFLRNPRGGAIFKTMIILLAFSFCQLINSSLKAQNAVITVKSKTVSLAQLIAEIETQAGYLIVYSNREIDTRRQFNVRNVRDNVSSFLQQALKDTDFTYDFENNYIVFRKEGATFGAESSQYMRVTGKVVDASGEPLPGASIKIKGLDRGIATNSDGSFTIVLRDSEKPKNIILQVSFIGMKSQEVAYKGTPLTIKMQDDQNVLADVVITGYQRISKRHSTSSITSVKAEDILTPGTNTIDVALQGRIPDLMTMQNSGASGATARLRVRGTSTILGNREPLWVVDGFIISDPVNVDPQQLNDPDFVNLIGNAIAGVNPQDIDRIDVLKDA